MSKDLTADREPTEAELEAWLVEHPSSYARPGRFTFLRVQQHGVQTSQDLTLLGRVAFVDQHAGDLPAQLEADAALAPGFHHADKPSATAPWA